MFSVWLGVDLSMDLGICHDVMISNFGHPRRHGRVNGAGMLPNL